MNVSALPLEESALRERVKELSCLYSIAQISGSPLATLEEILQEVVTMLPAAWCYPDSAVARIVLDQQTFSSSKHHTEGPSQTSTLVVRGVERGYVQILYSIQSPAQQEEPFLEEEQRLLNEVARQLSLIVDRKETTAEQERLQSKLQHADRLVTIGQLAAGVAHELHEPLNSILGFAQLACKVPDVPQQALADIAKIEAAALHGRKIIRQLLTFARQKPLQDSRVNITQLVRESADTWLARCASSGVQVEYALDDHVPPIVADESQIRQVVTNLVLNAVQAMPTGGILRIQTSVAEPNLRLSIADTGTGIHPDILPRIFDPFFTTKDVNQGTGLGLSVVHGIITAHKGHIAVESTPDKGTHVRVSLPISHPPERVRKQGAKHAKYK